MNDHKTPERPVAEEVPTTTRSDRWQPYLDQIKDLFGLRDWRITLENGDCDPTAYATFNGNTDKREGRIYLCTEWEDLDPEQQRRTIVHELLHTHLHEMDTMVQHDIASQLGPQANGIAIRAFAHQAERAVDQIANAVAEHFPLPATTGAPSEAPAPAAEIRVLSRQDEAGSPTAASNDGEAAA